MVGFDTEWRPTINHAGTDVRSVELAWFDNLNLKILFSAHFYLN